MAAVAWAALGCGSGSVTTTSSSDPSLLDPSQARSSDLTVHISPAGVSPQVMHLDSPVTVKFVNDDAVAHKLEEAPELRFGGCPELAQLEPLDPGRSGTVTIKRNGGVICAYHDAAGPSNIAFQGLLVVH